jgi:allantoinase
VVRWMATAPAHLAGLPGKGHIGAGAAADLVVFAPDATFEVGTLHHRNPLTPYSGRTLTGVVRQTWLAGRPVDDVPRGRLLERA